MNLNELNAHNKEEFPPMLRKRAELKMVDKKFQTTTFNKKIRYVCVLN